jgi:hypothetical protein
MPSPVTATLDLPEDVVAFTEPSMWNTSSGIKSVLDRL